MWMHRTIKRVDERSLTERVLVLCGGVAHVVPLLGTSSPRVWVDLVWLHNVNGQNVQLQLQLQLELPLTI